MPETTDFYEADENPEDVMLLWHEADEGLTRALPRLYPSIVRKLLSAFHATMAEWHMRRVVR
jgi:hypothetical protein